MIKDRRRLILANQKKGNTDVWRDLVYYFNFNNNIREHVHGIDGTNPNGALSFTTDSKSGTHALNTIATRGVGATVSGIPLSHLGSNVEDIAISFWVKIPGSIASYSELIRDSVNVVDNRITIHVGYARDGKIYFDFPDAFNNNGQRFTTEPIISDFKNYTHIICTANATTNYIFVNGVLIASFTNKKTTKLDTTGLMLEIERRPNNTYVGNCYLDSLAIWSRMLTQSEVTELYNNGSGLFYV